jgi:hypothetical protein
MKPISALQAVNSGPERVDKIAFVKIRLMLWWVVASAAS